MADMKKVYDDLIIINLNLFCEFALNRHQFIENLSPNADVGLIKSQNDACHKILGSIDQEGGPQ